MADKYSLPDTQDIRTYLDFKGWTEHPPGSAGTLWTKDSAQIGIPNQLDEDLTQDVLRRLARTERRSTHEVANAARSIRYDVTHLRAVNDYTIQDKIPLETATKIIGSARTMLRASATTARKERAQIGGSYSPLGDAVVRDSFMGHTEQGSFVIPILVPIQIADSDNSPQPMLTDGLPEFYSTPPELFERRVTRTFMQSVQALNELVITPSRPPSTDDAHQLVYRGVSREFCSAFASVLGQTSVAEFETQISWSPRLSPPSGLPESVSVDAEAAELVQIVADRLKQQRILPIQVFTGPIVQFRRDEKTLPYCEVGISTVRRGRSSEVRVRLTEAQYEQAWAWHNAQRPVLLEGTARAIPGRHSIVENPVRFHPLDELFLEGLASNPE